MSKRVFVLSGSPRLGGNTDRLACEFASGAKEAGHEVEKVFLCKKSVNACRGCTTCMRNGGSCILKDDMAEIYRGMSGADVIALAAPVYFYTWNAQMKAALDRTIALSRTMSGKTFYLLSAGMAPDQGYMEPMIEDFRRYIGCFEGSREGGFLFAYGTDKPGDVERTPGPQQAFEMGKRI